MLHNRLRGTGNFLVVLLGVVLCVVGQAHAAPDPSPGPVSSNTHSLEDCFALALKRSETLAIQEETIRQAEETYRQAVGGVLPTVTGTAQYFMQQSVGGLGISPFFTSSQPLVKFNLAQPLFRGFREYAALRSATASTQQQEALKQAASLTLYQDVATAFYEVLSLEQDQRILVKQIGLAENRVRELEQRSRIGRSRQSEVLTLKTTLATLRSQKEQLIGQIQASREVLTFLTGASRELQIMDTVKTPAVMPPLQEFLDHLEERPDIVAQVRSVTVSAEALSIARGFHLPDADFSANYYLVRQSSLQDIKWDMTVGLSLPIFQGGVVQSQVRAAASQLSQAELAAGLKRREADQSVRTNFAAWNSDRAQLEQMTSAAAAAERNYEVQSGEYRLGLVTNLDVLQALNSFHETSRSLERLRLAEKLDYIRLIVASGQALGQALGQTSGRNPSP